MKVINPNKKSDFVVLTWHKQHKRFESPKQLKLALIESFPDHVPSHLEFQIGYIEGRSSHSKRWIISINDVDAMYEVYMDGDDITLWCDGKNKPPRKGKRIRVIVKMSLFRSGKLMKKSSTKYLMN